MSALGSGFRDLGLCLGQGFGCRLLYHSTLGFGVIKKKMIRVYASAAREERSASRRGRSRDGCRHMHMLSAACVCVRYSR